ncbi:MAG: UDP-N-acetylmuramoyl-L-alanyl-D-glutamate--2,6-diaminopimelate ligase [Firmicutes bacterium]|nr:UDP-N-acetylmuramoyl-L-alanyl-D-glutamate--2,6-diaminopimelate ligase [Bacillota bacterium]
MLLHDLFRGIEYTGTLPPGGEIPLVTEDSRRVVPGCVFVCAEGKNFDGHAFARQAVGQGAACVVAQKDTGVSPQILVKNARETYALLCGNFFGNPARKLILVGVTGTNGKTTIACLLKEIFDAAGYKSGLIGTLKILVDQEELSTDPDIPTTPGPWRLHYLFARMLAAGCTHCFMEVSSMALVQQRCAGLRFAAGIYTNLTQDHLDYHGTFEAYFEAKKLLFFQSGIAVVNVDDEYGPGMLEGIPARPVTYSLTDNHADYTAKNVRLLPEGVSYELVSRGQIGRIRFCTPGEFSVYNSMAAACAALELGLPLEQVQEALAQSEGVKGRMEVLQAEAPYTIIIDYAHSPDGLDKVLRTLRQIVQGRVICVFGCGGERDVDKRPMMGRIAAELSDVAIVSSDNPRGEDPRAIIADVVAGMKRGRAQVVTEPDRARAVVLALKKAREGDTVLLAGKGHEDYQVLAGGKVHLDERDIVFSILKCRKRAAERKCMQN